MCPAIWGLRAGTCLGGHVGPRPREPLVTRRAVAARRACDGNIGPRRPAAQSMDFARGCQHALTGQVAQRPDGRVVHRLVARQGRQVQQPTACRREIGRDGAVFRIDAAQVEGDLHQGADESPPVPDAPLPCPLTGRPGSAPISHGPRTAPACPGIATRRGVVVKQSVGAAQTRGHRTGRVTPRVGQRRRGGSPRHEPSDKGCPYRTGAVTRGR